MTEKELKWLDLAESIGQIFSTCSRRKYGCLIIAKNGRIIGTGYNGSAPNSVHCIDGGCPGQQAMLLTVAFMIIVLLYMQRRMQLSGVTPL